MRRWRQVVGRWLRRMGLRPPPLDWETPGDVEADSPPGAVEIVVPVHGAHGVAAECLAAVARHTDLGRHRLLVVVDGDPGFTDADARRPFAAADDVVVLRHERPRGYVASCNRALALSRRDAVLLNSDTRVTAGWLDKLQAAAYSHPAVATATPWSNNATICSLPRPLAANELPPGHDDASFARLVEAAAERRYPRLPTGVGMCLYVKRRALERVGAFDEAAFGEGYGEETDFCLRALKAGFVHVLDDATFVYHHGQQSFGGRRAARVRTAERRMARRHPEYVATIADFLRRDPLAGPRRRILWALEGRRRTPTAGPARVLHVVHGWPPHNLAGTELYAHWLARWQSRHREVAVYARVADPERSLGEATEIDDGGVRVRLVVNNFQARDPLVRNALRSRVLEADFDRFAAAVDPELIHVHHLAGHALSLMGRAAARGVPVVYQVQDWWAYCARANLMQPDRGLCSGPAPGKCAACLPLTRRPPAALWNRLLYRYRGALAARALARADAYVMGSRYIERCYRGEGLLRPDDRVWVLPYGVPVPPKEVRERRLATPPSPPLRCGFIGSLLPHKGAHVAVAAFRGMDPRRAVLDVWGDPEISPAYARELAAGATAAVRFHGRFAESEKSEIFARLDVLLVPSLGLESFGLVAREAIAHGVPVIASRRGALEELFDEDGRGGAFVAPGDAAGLRRLVDALAERPETVVDWIRAAPRVVDTEEHAAAIEEVYAQLGRASAT